MTTASPLTTASPMPAVVAHASDGASPVRPQSRLARWLTGAGWALAIVAALATLPYLTAVLAFVAMALAQTAGRVEAARWRRQERRGVRRSDTARSVVGWPWHLVASLPSTAFTVGCGVLIGALTVQVGVSTGTQIRDSLVAGSALCVLTWCRGPFASRHVQARRQLVTVTTPPPSSRWVWLLLLVLVALAALTVQQAAGPLWWPLTAAPSVP
jgi:hypothetical protein